VLAILSSPAILRRFVSLDWYIGDMTLVAIGLQVLFLLLFTTFLLARRRIDQALRSVFPTLRHFIFAALSIVVSLALVIGAIEVVLRVLGLPYRMKMLSSDNAIIRFDGDLGWAYIPKLSTVRKFGTKGREVAVHFEHHALLCIPTVHFILNDDL
jgi:hypothetical protein